MDYRNDISKDDFLIVYGHRMSFGKMFSDITKYENRNYFDFHQNGAFYDSEREYSLKVVGFAKVRADDRMIYGNFSRDLVTYLRKNAQFWNEINGDKYILLSTCDAKDKSLRNVLLLIMEQ